MLKTLNTSPPALSVPNALKAKGRFSSYMRAKIICLLNQSNDMMLGYVPKWVQIMAVITKSGVHGKIFSTCKRWKPLEEFPTDPTHGKTPGGRHCRCKSCHRIAYHATKHKAV